MDLNESFDSYAEQDARSENIRTEMNDRSLNHPVRYVVITKIVRMFLIFSIRLLMTFLFR